MASWLRSLRPSSACSLFSAPQPADTGKPESQHGLYPWEHSRGPQLTQGGSQRLTWPPRLLIALQAPYSPSDLTPSCFCLSSPWPAAAATATSCSPSVLLASTHLGASQLLCLERSFPRGFQLHSLSLKIFLKSHLHGQAFLGHPAKNVNTSLCLPLPALPSLLISSSCSWLPTSARTHLYTLLPFSPTWRHALRREGAGVLVWFCSLLGPSPELCLAYCKNKP